MVSHSNFHTLWLSVELPNFPFYFDFTVCRNVVILWQMSINLWLLYEPFLLGLYMYFDLPVMEQTWQKTCKVMTQHSHSLIVCLGFFFPLKNVSLIWRRNHYGWRASNFDLCWALTWGFLSVPHLLWHWASIYIGHLRGPVTLAPTAERLAVELSLPVFTT